MRLDVTYEPDPHEHFQYYAAAPSVLLCFLHITGHIDTRAQQSATRSPETLLLDQRRALQSGSVIHYVHVACHNANAVRRQLR